MNKLTTQDEFVNHIIDNTNDGLLRYICKNSIKTYKLRTYLTDLYDEKN